MMSVPFFLLLAGFAYTWAGKRSMALACWALSMLGLMVLFKLQATDPLSIVL